MTKLRLIEFLGYFMAALAGLLFGWIVHDVLTAMAGDVFEIPAVMLWVVVTLNALLATVLFRRLDKRYGPASHFNRELHTTE